MGCSLANVEVFPETLQSCVSANYINLVAKVFSSAHQLFVAFCFYNTAFIFFAIKHMGFTSFYEHTHAVPNCFFNTLCTLQFEYCVVCQDDTMNAGGLFVGAFGLLLPNSLTRTSAQCSLFPGV